MACIYIRDAFGEQFYSIQREWKLLPEVIWRYYMEFYV